MINASRLWDLADAAGQLCGGDADLVDVLIEAHNVREEAAAARALVSGLQALVEEQRVELERREARISELEKRNVAGIICAYHAGVITLEESLELARPRVPNLKPGMGPMPRRQPRPRGRPLLQLVRGALAAITAFGLASCAAQHPGSAPVLAQVHVADRSTPGAVSTPTPAPPTPTPTPAPVEALQAPTPTAAPAPPRLRVVGPGVDVAIVGNYSDCTTGKTPVGWGGAYFDTCFTNTFVIAHPAFFSAMNGWPVGTAVTYYDATGVAHQLHITSTAVYPPHALLPTAGIGPVTFQVCTTNVVDSPIRVLGAAP